MSSFLGDESIDLCITSKMMENTDNIISDFSLQLDAINIRPTSDEETPVKSPEFRCHTANAVLSQTKVTSQTARRSRHLSLGNSSSLISPRPTGIRIPSSTYVNNMYSGASSVFTASYESDDAYVSPLIHEKRQKLNFTDGWHDFCVKDIYQASSGEKEVQETLDQIPALEVLKHTLVLKQLAPKSKNSILGKTEEKKPLANVRALLCIHINAAAALMIQTLIDLGAEVRCVACNLHSTRDNVAAYLASKKVPVYGWANMTEDEFWKCLDLATSTFVKEKKVHWHPNFLLDNGEDAVSRLFTNHTEIFNQLQGVVVETQEGAKCLYDLKYKNCLNFPCLNTSLSELTKMFKGSIQIELTVVDALRRYVDTTFRGKEAMILGYGRVGKAAAKALASEKIRVSVVEVDPIRALQASLEGFAVVGLEKIGNFDLVITATGCPSVIRSNEVKMMKNNAVLGSIGSCFELEIDFLELKSDPTICVQNTNSKVKVLTINTSRKVHLLADGEPFNDISPVPSLVNSVIACTRIMSIYELARKKSKYNDDIYLLPKKAEDLVARIHVETLGGKIFKEIPVLFDKPRKSTNKEKK